MVAEYSASSNEILPDAVLLAFDLLRLRSNFTHRWSNVKWATHYNPQPLIGLELSLVREVESVFVELVQKQRTVRVISVINERNPGVRARIYAREQAIIDSFPMLDFDFRVISRANRPLSEVVDQLGTPAYRR
jgi:hypothetical protein